MFRFNQRKTIQAIAVLMGEPGCDNRSYFKLLKLLYMAERESLIETGHPLTGDETKALPRGPVLGVTCDLMRGEAQDPLWSAHLAGDVDYQLQLIKDPGDGELSQYELEKLKEVAARYHDKDRWATADEVHKVPEQKKREVPGSSRTILVEDILEAGGVGGRIKGVIRRAKADDALSAALGI